MSKKNKPLNELRDALAQQIVADTPNQDVAQQDDGPVDTTEGIFEPSEKVTQDAAPPVPESNTVQGDDSEQLPQSDGSDEEVTTPPAIPGLDDEPFDVTALADGFVPQPPVWQGDSQGNPHALTPELEVDQENNDVAEVLPEPTVGDPVPVHPAFADKWEALCPNATALKYYRELTPGTVARARSMLEYIDVMELQAKTRLVTVTVGIKQNATLFRSMIRAINSAKTDRRTLLNFYCACILHYRSTLFHDSRIFAFNDYMTNVGKGEVLAWENLLYLLVRLCDPRGRQIVAQSLDLQTTIRRFTGPGLLNGDAGQALIDFAHN